MSGIDIDIFAETLFEAIEVKDVDKTLLMILKLKEMVRSDPIAVKWVTDPKTIKSIHDNLVEHLDVSAKAMMIKNRVPNRQRRAYLFTQALENGIRKTLDG